MDAIVSAAAVSKPTVYKHFGDKQRLFEQIVGYMIGGFTQRFYDQVMDLADDRGVEDYLRQLARLLLTAVMQMGNLRPRRLVIGEASRFPELGHAYEEQGPNRAIAALMTAFARLADNELVQLDAPAFAAEQFNWLVVSVPLNHAMLSGDNRTRAGTAFDGMPTKLSAFPSRVPSLIISFRRIRKGWLLGVAFGSGVRHSPGGLMSCYRLNVDSEKAST